MKIRFLPIVDRLDNTLRYVDLNPKNMSVFSYEFASILRDIGSIFSSICDSYVSGVKNDNKIHTITHFRRFLLSEMKV